LGGQESPAHPALILPRAHWRHTMDESPSPPKADLTIREECAAKVKPTLVSIPIKNQLETQN